METPVCPVCGKLAQETRTRFGIRHSCCGLWSWGGAPLVDARTHRARVKAHEAFDALWQSGMISRSKAYARLAYLLGLEPKDCHMKLMDYETARRVPAAVKRIKKTIRFARERRSQRDRIRNAAERKRRVDQ